MSTNKHKPLFYMMGSLCIPSQFLGSQLFKIVYRASRVCFTFTQVDGLTGLGTRKKHQAILEHPDVSIWVSNGIIDFSK